MSKSLATRLNALEGAFGKVHWPADSAELREFMASALDLSGREIPIDDRERLTAEYIELHERATAKPLVMADNDARNTAQIRHEAMILTGASFELVEVLAAAYDNLQALEAA